MAKADLMDRVVNLAKRRGFVFQSSEIYGGFRSTWDYGPLGVELKRNVKDAWWRSMVQLRDDVVGLDAAILMAPKVWEASGHLETFSDPLVDCRNCKERFRADQLPESGACPNCGAKGSFTEARQFHLMFKTHVGPVEDDGAIAYLRPETAQGIFVNFQNVQTTTRKKPPFGIAQIGKSFRNEITPGNFIFRTREFEQMEMEYFVPPDDSPRWYEYWCQERYRWYTDLGIPEEKLRLRPHDADELSHYSIGTSDVEFLYPWGWGELEGIAQRTDFDLREHSKFSGQDLSYYDQENDRRYLPYVVEPAAGADRATLAFLLSAYDEDEAPNEKGGTDTRTVLRFDPRLAPIKVAVLPLSRNDKLVPVSDEVATMLRPHLMIDVDTAGSIGRRYRRQDEIGTPFCVTVDFDTLDDKAVTIRDRDTMTQDRVPLDTLLAELQDRLGAAMTDDTYYDELGVSPQASRDELKAAYQERISELEAARDRKGVSDAQLQGNREQVARIRAAWNVLADPFQRSRYDERIGSASTNGDASDYEDGDDADVDDDASSEPGVQLTGWRKLMAPAPPRKPAAGAGNGKPPPPQRPVKEPTIPIPAGMRLADSRSRGMALLFDFAVVLVIYWVVLLVVPGVINSEYKAKVDSINHLNSLHDAQSDIDDAQSSISDANKAIAKAENSDNSSDLKDAESDKASAQKDLKSAQSDFDDAAKDVQKDGLPVKHNADAIQKQADKLGDDIRGAQYGSYLVVLVLAMLYLVPATVITGRTLGMRGRRIRIVRVDGSPVGWYGAFVRFFLPIILALAIPTIGPLLGLGMVLWGYRDANGQGIHDKLARTLVVADAQ